METAVLELSIGGEISEYKCTAEGQRMLKQDCDMYRAIKMNKHELYNYQEYVTY